jgi:hypothetical protein
MDAVEGIAILIAPSISGLVGIAVAQAKKASLRQGFAWGFVLGPIGWLIAALVLQPVKRKTVADSWRESQPSRPRAKM